MRSSEYKTRSPTPIPQDWLLEIWRVDQIILQKNHIKNTSSPRDVNPLLLTPTSMDMNVRILPMQPSLPEQQLTEC